MVPERRRVRVALTGELDIACSGNVVAEVRGLVDRGFGDVLVDLTALTFIDSSGIHALLTCVREAAQRGALVSVLLAPGGVTRAVDLCGVREQLNVEPRP